MGRKDIWFCFDRLGCALYCMGNIVVDISQCGSAPKSMKHFIQIIKREVKLMVNVIVLLPIVVWLAYIFSLKGK